MSSIAVKVQNSGAGLEVVWKSDAGQLLSVRVDNCEQFVVWGPSSKLALD
jgi:hypothetical protein